MSADTLAHRLGTTTHIPPLLMKSRRLGLRSPADLCTLAAQRGCEYYNVGSSESALPEEAPLRVSGEDFPNAELAAALLTLFPAVILSSREAQKYCKP